MKNRSSAFRFGVISIILLATLTAAHAQRLPSTVRPDHYTLSFTPDIKAATFSGTETIDLALAEPSDAITLNALEIAIQSISVTSAGKTQQGTVTFDKEKEQATFHFAEKLPAGKAQLKTAFTGILNNQLRGFYLSKTAKRSYAVTQFESTDARRAFPSFDEPAFKATFDVSVVIDAGDTAISNGGIVSDTPGPGAGKHTLRFDTTPKMSSYLVAFLIGDFQCTEGESEGVKIRGCATPDKVGLTPYSVETAKSVLRYYNEYFGIPYPLKKLDLIAIPDFEAGAMENFGAITYREKDLLIDAKTASVGSKRNVELVVAHEMAHQWFGDLVTMQWWDNVWLNEGFATWMENKAVAARHPEWEMDQLVADDEQTTLNLDAQPTTHAIRARADSREEIEEMFDGISYGKGSDVLLAVENYLGPEVFRQGVHNYLAAHLYGNATAEDFWGAQKAVSHKPVDKVMESYVAQPGEPLVSFGVPTDDKVPVSQSRFFLSPSRKPDASQKWTIPVCFKTAAGQDCQLLTPETASLATPGGTLPFANAGGKSYYRTAYPPSVYAELAAHVETGLTSAERITLIGDEWVQVRANKATVGDYLNLVSALRSDTHAKVVKSALEAVHTVYKQVAGTSEEQGELSAWLRATFVPEYAKLPKPSPTDSDDLRELRAELLDILGNYAKDPDAVAEARRIAEQYLDDPSQVDATLGQQALEIAARYGDQALFDRLQKVAESSTNPEIQEDALGKLANFEDPALAERALEYASSGKVRSQDALLQYRNSMQSDANRAAAWSYIKSHWDKLEPLLTPELGSVLVRSAENFCDADSREDVRQFYAAHRVPSADQALKRTLERIDGCIELRRLQEPNLKQWLASQPGQ